MEYEFRLADKDDLKIIVELLKKVTLDLHQRNIMQWTSPWSSYEIEMNIKNKDVYVVTIDKLIIGTFSIKNMDISDVLHVTKPNNLYLFRIAILPKYQGNGLGVSITDYAKETSKKLGKAIYLDCWAGNLKLRDFYTRAEFDFCGDFPEEDYMISVFRYENK